MGTSIDGFFPHSIERTEDAILARLDAILARLGDDLAIIRDGGRFSSSCAGWGLWYDKDEDAVIGEGPYGLSISVYPNVVVFGSLERFSSIERPEQCIHVSLRRVFEAVASGLGGGGALAVASSGFGDTDAAHEVAMDGGGFDKVCCALEEVLGPPSRSWEALEADSGWYLSAPGTELGNAENSEA